MRCTRLPWETSPITRYPGLGVAGPGRRTHPVETRQAAVVGDDVGPVAELADVGAAGDAPDPVDGGAVPAVAVVRDGGCGPWRI